MDVKEQVLNVQNCFCRIVGLGAVSKTFALGLIDNFFRLLESCGAYNICFNIWKQYGSITDLQNGMQLWQIRPFWQLYSVF